MLKPITATAWLHGAAAQPKADGTSNTVEVSAGIYTLKEDVCPKGYAKAADRTVAVKAGATTEVAISDMPQSDPISILLQKVDRETGKAVPLGAAILKDAEYLVSYYDGQYDTAKAAVDSGEPTRQWVLKTDEDGFCDLDFVKVKDSSMARLAGVPFKITSKTTGESHIIVTDANGYANTSSSWNLHTNNTNRGQSDEDGIWFEMDREGNKTTKVDNALGALPYDLYVLDEMPCDANKGCRLLEGIEIAVTRDSGIVKLGTLTDDAIEIETTAKDSETGGHFAKADEKVTIIDIVKYTGLYKNKEYVMKGTLMDKETGKPLLDKEGKEITAEQKFTAKSDNGTVEMSFTFDASLMQGKTTVVFESVFYEELEVAVHSDIEDEGQTVTFEQPPAEHSPKTGDDLPMIPIIALLAASAAGISAALIRRKHKAGSDDSDE